MSAAGSAHLAQRLDLAGTRDFAGAGQARRRAISDLDRAWLATLWKDATSGRGVEGVALGAVGSLGREEAGPLSDFDLVLIYRDRARTKGAITELAEALWYPIWDAGVRLDHSVRTVTDCRNVAADDLTAVVGLLDLSLVAGDESVIAQARTSVASDWRSGARKRLPSLIEAVEARHARHGELSQSVEPDLKESRGGLRDMSIIRALTQAWLTDRPRGDIDSAYATLLDARDALQIVTGRSRDRLGREDQDAVAAMLGLDDADELLTRVLGAGSRIAYALDATLRRAGQSQRARTLRVGPRRPQMAPLGYGLYVSDSEVVAGSASAARTDPLLPLRAALLAARAGLPISPTTLDNLAAAPPIQTPWPAAARDILGDFLAAGAGVLPVWEGLDHAGIIELWLPEWAAVRNRPQHNPVHTHTVDRHLLDTVVEAADLAREVARPDLLVIAALLHDIGKVAGARDHSERGADIASGVVARWGLPAGDAAVVTRLVREHLTFVELATRRDQADPATVQAALTAVDHDPATADLLIALTKADARAAGPLAWTAWRAQLVAQLADTVRGRLGAAAPPSPTPIDATPLPVAEASARSGAVTVECAPDEGGTERVVITAPDRDGLFADTAAVLAAAQLTVRGATLHTIDGEARDDWYVESPGGDRVDAATLARDLDRLARGDRGALASLERTRPRAARPSGASVTGAPGQTQAFVIPGASEVATVLEVRTGDRPGVLHDIGRAIGAAGASVRSAHIATYAGQTLDTFYLVGPDGGQLVPAVVADLVGRVIDACEGVA